MDKDEARRTLIDLIYDAGFDDGAFYALPARLADFVNGRSCTLQFLDDPSLGLAASYFPNSLWDTYVSDFKDKDLWLTRGTALAPVNQFFVFDEFVPHDEFINSEIYNDFFRAFGDDTAHGTGCKIQVGDGAIGLGIHRETGRGAFAGEDTAHLQTLVPALRHLYAVRAKLRKASDKQAIAQNALDHFASAIWVVDQNRKIRQANAAADDYLAEPEAHLLARRGHLHARDPNADRWFQDALSGVLAPSPRPGARLLRDLSGAPRLQILVTFTPDRKCAVVIADRHTSLAIDSIARLYKLSPAEIQLITALLNGHSLDEFRHARAISITTARSQLSSILRKTESDRQADLIARLMPLTRTL